MGLHRSSGGLWIMCGQCINDGPVFGCGTPEIVWRGE